MEVTHADITRELNESRARREREAMRAEQAAAQSDGTLDSMIPRAWADAVPGRIRAEAEALANAAHFFAPVGALSDGSALKERAAELQRGPILIPGPNAHHPEYYQLVREIVAISEKKNKDYADRADPLRNFRKCAAFGVPPWKGILTRMSDKWSRLESLADGTDPAVTDESIEDTLQDLANYCLLAIVARRTMNDDGSDRAPLEQATMAA